MGNISCESGRLRCRPIMHERTMRNRNTTSTRQSLRSWLTFRREIAQSLPSLLFALAVGTLQGCGDGSSNASPGESLTSIAPNSAIISWSQPTTNQDGSPLTDLLGYQVYYGQTTPLTATGSQTILIFDPDQTSYTISDLPSGANYFAVTALDTDGNESEMSEETIKTIE